MACYRQRLGEKVGNVEEARDKDDPEMTLAKIWRSFVAMRPVAKRPPYSASATKEQTTGMRVECVEMGWLRGESSGKSPR